ncbi:hypothetical protein [Paenibacillus aquistagni]|uniref:Type IV pilus assembly protein PilO n=1 Tax=Paenibacillus aquistagni TaxID=1852522 RepID=A0A1X7LTX9_9BACL|nr:hypothetical protein [Paenibacillus aquistagni]SMG56599.1 hypothetical protein SAMN06295960_4166 [Paenibacillus aquistagni]
MMNAKQLRLIALIAASIVIISGLALYYVYGIQPIKQTIAQEKDKIKLNQKMLETLQAQTQLSKQSEADLVELQKKVPVESFSDLLIMELRKREQDTSSVITNYSFTSTLSNTEELLQAVPIAKGDANTAGAGAGRAAAPAAAEAPTDGTKDDGAEGAASTAEAGEQAPAAVPLSLDVYKLSVNLEVESPSYVKFNSFLKSVEAMERVVKVDSITFDDSKNTYSLSITVFYAPQFYGIEEQLPPGTFPAPSGKKVPVRSINPVNVPTEP